MKTSIFKVLGSAFALVVITSGVRADVVAFKVRLTAAVGGDPFAYQVPIGKVFIIEQIIFNDVWVNGAQDLEVDIRHEGISSAGSICCTTLRYSIGFNSLLRPIKLPGGVGIAVKNLGSPTHRCYFYGVLADTADLFATNVEQLKDVELAGSGGSRILQGTVTLKSPRPTKLTVEGSTNLNQWNKVAELSGGAGGETTIQVPAPSAVPRSFVRVEGRARPNQLLMPFLRRIILPLGNEGNR